MEYCERCDGSGIIEEHTSYFHPEIGECIGASFERECYHCDGTGLDLTLLDEYESDYDDIA